MSIVFLAGASAASNIATIESILAQSFADFELILVAHGRPPDDWPAGVDVDARCHRSFKCVTVDEPGAVAAKNVGVLASWGRYVTFLDAGDRWDPEFLSELIGHLERHAECAAACAVFGPAGAVSLRALLLRECAVAAGAVVVRRDALMSVGLFDQSLAQGHEDDLWLRLVHGGHELHRCNLALATPRAVPADPIAECDRELDVLYKASRTLRLDRDDRLALRERASLVIRRRDLACARQLVARGDFDAARHHLHAIWPASVKVRVLRTALAFAPRLLRAVHIPQLFLTSDS